MKGKRNPRRAATTIYDTLGGEKAVRALVDGLYFRIVGDVVLRPFFARADMEALKKSQVLFFCQLLGGPQQYRGPGIRELHADGLPLEEIAVLVRLNARSADFEEIFTQARIPFQGAALLTRDAARQLLQALNRSAPSVAGEVRQVARAQGLLEDPPDRLGERVGALARGRRENASGGATLRVGAERDGLLDQLLGPLAEFQLGKLVGVDLAQLLGEHLE